jgi:uncharacterized protein (TIGR02118 family)
MFKAIIVLSRRTDMTHEEFVEWWLEEHAPLAARLPGLRRLVFNVVDVSPAEAGPDGISELWFGSQADFDAAYGTQIGKAVAADSVARVSGRVRLFVTEHEVADALASGHPVDGGS